MLLSELDDPLRDNFGLKLGRRKIFGRSVVSFLGTGFGTETWLGVTILGICCSANLFVSAARSGLLYFSNSLARLPRGVEVDTTDSVPCNSSCLVSIIGRRILSDSRKK
jgi:hypothetical protein